MGRTPGSFSAEKTMRIIDAAQRQFITLGFRNATMDSIATEAGISKQTLYNRYPDKQSLFLDVLKEYIQKVAAGATAMPDTIADIAELREALNVFGSAIVATIGNPEYLGFMRAVLPEMPLQPELQKIFSNNMPERIIGSLSKLIDSARTSGTVRDVRSELIARMFAGTLLTYILQRGVLANDSQVLLPDEIDAIVQQFIELIQA